MEMNKSHIIEKPLILNGLNYIHGYKLKFQLKKTIIYCTICIHKKKVNNEKIINLKPASIAKPSSSKSIYGSYANDKSGFEFLECIVSVIQKELFEELNSSPYWSIMIDETNTINNKYLAIVGKYM